MVIQPCGLATARRAQQCCKYATTIYFVTTSTAIRLICATANKIIGTCSYHVADQMCDALMCDTPALTRIAGSCLYCRASDFPSVAKLRVARSARDFGPIPAITSDS